MDDDFDKKQRLYGELVEMLHSCHSLPAIDTQGIVFFLIAARRKGSIVEYILDRISSSASKFTTEQIVASVHEELTALVQKLFRNEEVPSEIEAALRERDGNRCFVTGKSSNLRPTHIISPSVVEDADLQPGGYLRPLFEATLSKEGVEELFALLSHRGQENELKNLVLLDSHVHDAFRMGQFSINKSPYLESPLSEEPGMKPTNDWKIGRPALEMDKPLPTLPSDNKLYRMPTTVYPMTHPLPQRALLSAQRIFSEILIASVIKKEIATGWPSSSKASFTLGRTGRWLLRSALLMLSVSMRIQLYHYISNFVRYWDPSQTSHVLRLPLGLCLKGCRENSANEANALLLAEKYTNVNAPRLIDSVVVDEYSGYLLMTTVPGETLASVFLRTTWEERRKIAEDLGKLIIDLRRIPNTSSYLIADTLGGPVCDHRFSQELWGPFNTTSDFTDRLTRDVFRGKKERPLTLLYDKKHEVCFTHSDIHLSNIMVQNGQLVGLVDWENAGFKPEYWEFTRALWPYGGTGTACHFYRWVFKGKYDEEYKADVFILRNSPYIL